MQYSINWVSGDGKINSFQFFSEEGNLTFVPRYDQGPFKPGNAADEKRLKAKMLHVAKAFVRELERI